MTPTLKLKILNSINEETKQATQTDIRRIQIIPPLQQIADCVCRYYDISHEKLKHSRRGQINLPKLLCMYIARKRFGYSMKEIANMFLPTTHTTVSTSIYKLGKHLGQDTDLNNQLEEVVSLIKHSNFQGEV